MTLKGSCHYTALAISARGTGRTRELRPSVSRGQVEDSCECTACLARSAEPFPTSARTGFPWRPSGQTAAGMASRGRSPCRRTRMVFTARAGGAGARGCDIDKLLRGLSRTASSPGSVRSRPASSYPALTGRPMSSTATSGLKVQAMRVRAVLPWRSTRLPTIVSPGSKLPRGPDRAQPLFARGLAVWLSPRRRAWRRLPPGTATAERRAKNQARPHYGSVIPASS